MGVAWEVLETVRFALPALPPSKNQLHQVIRQANQPLIFKRSKEYQLWLSEIGPALPLTKPLGECCFFRIDAIFHYPWYHKNGNLKRKDGHNFLEALCDAIAAKNGFDDSYIRCGSWDTVNDERELIEGSLCQIRPSSITGAVPRVIS